MEGKCLDLSGISFGACLDLTPRNVLLRQKEKARRLFSVLGYTQNPKLSLPFSSYSPS